MNCPKCNGDMWDNRASKRKPTQPDFRCKDKDNCDGVIWPPREGRSNGAPASNGNGNGSHAPQQTAPTVKRPLGPLYNECLDFAKKACVHHFGNDASVSDIIASTATLFIQAVRDGTPIRAVAATPEPTPTPPPAPAPTPGYAQSNDKPLPF